MKKIVFTFVFLSALAFSTFAQIPPMTLSTTAFADGTIIPIKYSQTAPGASPGEGTSPALTWTNVPAGTQSLLLHMHDLDFVRNKTTDDQVHWIGWFGIFLQMQLAFLRDYQEERACLMEATRLV